MSIERAQERFKNHLNTIVFTILALPLFIYGMYCIEAKKAISTSVAAGVVYGSSAVGTGLVYVGLAGLLFFGLALRDKEEKPIFIFRAFGFIIAVGCILVGILYFGFV
ncbi:MAG: hypothetical protein KTR29_18200 [Rhodothermaceae bacterium]|nr:hypothetical protein [Rhodothermaceae bacterium]